MANRGRIQALDLLRGAFLIEIIANHIPWAPSIYMLLGGGGRLPASAAEGFFTISGLLVGYLYAPKILQNTWTITKKLWKRAALLYVLSTLFTLIFAAWATLDPLHAKWPGVYGGTMSELLYQTFTLQYVYGWADFLARYAVFMFVAPLAVWLVAKHRGWLVAGVAVGLWAWLRHTNIFQPYSTWQVVFMLGIVAGYYLPHLEQSYYSLKKRTQNILFGGIVGATLVSYFAFIVIIIALPYLAGHSIAAEGAKQGILQYFDKDTLDPARLLLGALWFTGFYMLFRRFEHGISRYTLGVLEVFGRQSLFVYGLHAFILFAIGMYSPPPAGHGVVANTIVTTLVLAAIYYAAAYRRWFTQFGRRVLNKKSQTQVP